MKLHYWGTAAAEGIPSFFCGCKVCVEAREKKGRHLRTRSQIMIDDNLLIDFNCDSYAHSLKYDYDMSKLKDIIITHIHEDHFYPDDLENRRVDFCHDVKYQTLTIHGSPDIKDLFEQRLPGRNYLFEKENRLAYHFLDKYTHYDIAGYDVVSFPATHGTPDPRVYLISKNGVNVLILNDTGVMKDEVFDWLKDNKIKLDLVSYDCTMGTMNTYKVWGPTASHMGFPNVIDTKNRFIANGNYKDDTVSIITHFSHNGSFVGYDDMKKIAEKEGFILAYDGYLIEV